MGKLSLPAFLGALSISGATENTFRQIVAAGYDTLEKIRDDLSVVDLAQLRTEGGVQIGELRAGKIILSLRSPRVKALLSAPGALRFIDMSSPAAAEAVDLKIDVKGKTFCLTGTGPKGRDELAAILRAAGAIVQSSVSKTTNYLLCEDANSTSSKAKKAREIGTTVLGYGDVFP